MTGNGFNPTYEHGDDWGMVQMTLFYPHFITISDIIPIQIGDLIPLKHH